MITKVLDNYYSNKLMNIIKNRISKKYYISVYLKKPDFNVKEEKNKIIVQIKKPEYKDEFYTQIFAFYKENAFEILCRYDEMWKEIEINIKEYLKGE